MNRMFDIPYNRRYAVRLFWYTGFHAGRVGLSHDCDYGIPVTTFLAGPFGYGQVFWHAVRDRGTA